MRRLNRYAWTGVALGLLVTGCQKRPATPATVEGPAPLASVVRTADPAQASQLIAGFHQIEQSAWRWTAHEFSADLRPPVGSAAKGAMLTLQFALPEAVFAKTGPVTVSAKVNGSPVTPQRFDKTGPQSYSAAVPASALTGETVRAEFAIDKFLAAGEVDQRELAVIVSSVGLEPVK